MTYPHNQRILRRRRLEGVRLAILCAAVGLTGSACSTTVAAPNPDAGMELELAVELDPRTLELSSKALSEERYGDARILLNRVFAAEPENLRGKFLLAELDLATGIPNSAAQHFHELLETPEGGPEAYQGQGISLILLGKEEEGLESLRRSVESDPSLWRAWNAIGTYYDIQGEWELARESYETAMTVNPKSALVHNNLGFSYLLQGKWDKAIKELTKALKFDPELSPAKSNLRLAFAWKGKYVYAMAGTHERDMGRVLNNVGFVALLRGDYVNAESYLLRAVEIDRGFNESATKNLAYLEDVRNIAEAEKTDKN